MFATHRNTPFTSDRSNKQTTEITPPHCVSKKTNPNDSRTCLLVGDRVDINFLGELRLFIFNFTFYISGRLFFQVYFDDH